MSQQRGSTVEESIGQFCERTFLKDFLFLRPTRASGGRELTDLMAVLDSKCLCIQIKAYGDANSLFAQHTDDWATKRLLEAGRQASGAIRKLKTTEVVAMHAWRGRVGFRPEELTPVCGVALVEYLGPPFRLRGAKSHAPGGVPIHYFSLNDFLNLTDLLGSLPDTIQYLQQRAEIPHDTKSIIGGERGLYAAYLLDGHLRSDLVLEQSSDRCNQVMGMTEAFERKRKHEIYAHFYNGIINELHNHDATRQSYTPPEILHREGMLSDESSYLKIAVRLNRLPSALRLEIGKRLFLAAKAVKNDGYTRSVVYSNLNQPWVLALLVTPKIDRTMRIRQLHLLVASCTIRYGCRSAVGVAVPSLDSNQGLDAIYVDKATYDSEQIMKAVPTIVKTSKITLHPFPDPTEDALLPKDEDFE